MTFSRQIDQFPTDRIVIDRPDRQRTNIVVSDLVDSIRRIGIMSPLLVERDGTRLVAGERRLTAARELGLAEVPVRWVEPGLSPVDLQIIELEENVRRSDLQWQDIVRAHQRIHQLHRSADPEWSMGETAASVGLTPGTLSIYLTVGARPADDTAIWECGTVREAYGMIQRRQQRAQGNALESLLQMGGDLIDAEVDDFSFQVGTAGPQVPVVGVDDDGEGDTAPDESDDFQAPDDTAFPVVAAKPLTISDHADSPSPAAYVVAPPVAAVNPVEDSAADSILPGVSFLDWAPTYTGKKFNFIHCDFPYGINLFAGEQGGVAKAELEYDDTPDTYFALLECFCRNLDRFTALSAHVMFWYSAKHEARTREMFADLAPSIKWSPYPLVWFKTDNKGISGDHRRHPRHVYETCLFGYRSDRNLVRIVADCYGAPTARLHHTSAKPVPMLKHFMTMIVDEHTSILDPTCGSGTALQAAEAMGAKRSLGLEIDPDIGVAALVELERVRRLAAVGIG